MSSNLLLRWSCALLIALCLPPFAAKAQQQDVPEVPYFTFGRGFGIAPPDSMYLLNIRFRVQNRVALNYLSDTDELLDEVEARVRRLRLRFDGFMFDPRITYVVQLSFARGDIDFEDTGFPNLVRDAMIFYALSPKWTIGLGQTKLPGNRQRVVSSGDLQFADRSIVNARFNIDRDFGIQAFYTEHFGDLVTITRLAITSGEGRNFNSTDRGLAYTGRVEVLPMGLFTSFGDYFEGDLMREPKPKLSIGLTYSHNQNATRVGGTIGPFLFEPRDINTWMADFILKYRGFAATGELFYRAVNDPITMGAEGEIVYVLNGTGAMVQSSYLFRKDWEIALRAAGINPNERLNELEYQHREYQVGLSRYIRGHRLKVQTDLTYDDFKPIGDALTPRSGWSLRFQVELGI